MINHLKSIPKNGNDLERYGKIKVPLKINFTIYYYEVCLSDPSKGQSIY